MSKLHHPPRKEVPGCYRVSAVNVAGEIVAVSEIPTTFFVTQQRYIKKRHMKKRNAQQK